MSTAVARSSQLRTVRDLLDRLGNVPLQRIRVVPALGTATPRDVVRVQEREGVLCELVDGVLVEKRMGYEESVLAIWIAGIVGAFVDSRKLGLVSGADGMVQLFPGLVRIPDVAFLSWDRLPGRKVPHEPFPDLVPDLAVEVLSARNTAQEMERKLEDYFSTGVRLVWYIDPGPKTARVYTHPGEPLVLGEQQTLNGGAVLPGFTLSLRKLFSRTQRAAPPKP